MSQGFTDSLLHNPDMIELTDAVDLLAAIPKSFISSTITRFQSWPAAHTIKTSIAIPISHAALNAKISERLFKLTLLARIERAH
jgi:hypothetical protein